MDWPGRPPEHACVLTSLIDKGNLVDNRYHPQFETILLTLLAAMDDESPFNSRALSLAGIFVLVSLLLSWYRKRDPLVRSITP